MHVTIRKFLPSDREAVSKVYRDGIHEHIIPLFTWAISQPFHISLTMCMFVMGYMLSGGSVGLALLAAVSWISLVFYCCYEFFAGYVRTRLHTDMQDIAGFYLSNPDNCFWVAEAEVNGRPQIMGLVALKAKKLPGTNGQKYGELFRMIVSSECRRAGLGLRLGNTVEDFCKERGFSKVVLETTSIQRAGVALYEKMGFRLVQTHTRTEGPWWVFRLTRCTILRMEKGL
ncbi:N-acetyltransferase 8-like 2 [Trichomycterus rosablanca]|uniref:N-acetyltransferase 8-like 2 n=1 Tax=Trichomycterus rosablanca TaxID=2290929 RepID=UPI002F359E82